MSDHVTIDPDGLLARTREELVVRGYAAKTLDGYLGHLRRFLAAEECEDGPPGEAGVRRYVLRMLEERGWSNAYANQCLCALRFFYLRVCAERLDVEALPRLQREKKLPTVLGKDEVTALFEAARGPRDRALLMLTYAAGLRVSEVARLRPEDLDPGRGLGTRRRSASGSASTPCDTPSPPTCSRTA